MITIADLGATPTAAEGSSIDIEYTITSAPTGGIGEEMYFYFGSDFDSDTAESYDDFYVNSGGGDAGIAPGPHDVRGAGKRRAVTGQ